LTLPFTCSTTTTDPQKNRGVLLQKLHRETPPLAYTDILLAALAASALWITISTDISCSNAIVCYPVFCICTLRRVCVCVWCVGVFVCVLCVCGVC
jgi:hypothetical protein